VGLLLKGEDHFKSAFGGVVTILGRLAVFAYLITGIVKLTSLQNSQNRLVWSNDVILNPSLIPINHENFKAAISLVIYDGVGEKQFDVSRYFRVQFNF